jgi:nucleotide-binding universal stress UspA family protein
MPVCHARIAKDGRFFISTKPLWESMYRFKKILVNLSLKGEEVELVKYAAEVSRLARAEQIRFLHVSTRDDLPPQVREKYPSMREPTAEASRERVARLVREHFDGYQGCRIDQQVLEGVELYEVLRIARDEDIDIILCDNPEEDPAFPVRLARKAPCSVMLVPQGARVAFQRVLVPVDFSKYAAYAVNVGVAFARARGLKEITLLNAYNIVQGSHKATVPESELVAMARDYAEYLARDFLAGQDLQGIVPKMELVRGTMPGHTAISWARENDVDLVVAGCRGKDAFSAALLGSNTEEMLRHTTVPLVAVKEKGTARGLLQSILDA